jgi:hypothetical protein
MAPCGADVPRLAPDSARIPRSAWRFRFDDGWVLRCLGSPCNVGSSSDCRRVASVRFAGITYLSLLLPLCSWSGPGRISWRSFPSSHSYYMPSWSSSISTGCSRSYEQRGWCTSTPTPMTKRTYIKSQATALVRIWPQPTAQAVLEVL